MIGVSGGITATLGILQPSMENFVQMAALMGAGKKSSVIVHSKLWYYKVF